MAVDILSPDTRQRQREALQRARISGCTKKEMFEVIYATTRRTFMHWLRRKLPALVTEDRYKTFTPAEVADIVAALGDPTRSVKEKFYESLK